MGLERLEPHITRAIAELEAAGRRKGREPVIAGVKPAQDGAGPRYFLAGYGERAFLRMNANSYLGLAHHPKLIEAEARAAERFGAGPGAVRFISGTFAPHVELERALAAFHGRESAMLMSAAYAAVMGVLPQLISDATAVISDELNHNSIINAVRLARPAAKAIYPHLDVTGLERALAAYAGKARRAVVVTDGVFSMRGDHAPLEKIAAICQKHEPAYPEGVITIVDDSHGVGAFGRTGRGTEEITGARADLLIGTLGKALGVNGGYVAASRTMIDYLRETAPFYIYSNPITPAEAAAALAALDILSSSEGAARLERLRRLAARLRAGLGALGLETIAAEHPIVPLIIRDTQKTAALVRHCFERNILVTGLTYPVVPKGEEEIRLQLSADQTERDVDELLDVLKKFRR
ncbi:MAG: aminotransferase class I/II-fold pyridoxal phosphate-dependent enzyme [Nitrospirota bacterium]